jgi:hypothetical protein
MGLDTSLQQFLESLNDLNHYLLYFPEENPKQLDQDEIIDQAKAPELLNSMKQCLMPKLFLFQGFQELKEEQAHQRSKSFLTTS